LYRIPWGVLPPVLPKRTGLAPWLATTGTTALYSFVAPLLPPGLVDDFLAIFAGCLIRFFFGPVRRLPPSHARTACLSPAPRPCLERGCGAPLASHSFDTGKAPRGRRDSGPPTVAAVSLIAVCHHTHAFGGVVFCRAERSSLCSVRYERSSYSARHCMRANTELYATRGSPRMYRGRPQRVSCGPTPATAWARCT